MVLTSLVLMLAAAPDATGIVAQMDRALNVAQDQLLVYEMIDEQPGKAARTLGIEVQMKGEMRMTEFTSPADLKGTKILIVSPTQMYIYLPAYKKVRRIASHVTEQGFMGTTYSSDDLALARYGDKYAATLLAEDETSARVRLDAKPGAEVPYPKIEVTIEKARSMPTELRYFGQGGKHVKTETRGDYTCEGGVCAPSVLEMTDHTSGGHKSRLVRKKWAVNQGLPDRVFSVRNLQRGQ